MMWMGWGGGIGGCGEWEAASQPRPWHISGPGDLDQPCAVNRTFNGLWFVTM